MLKSKIKKKGKKKKFNKNKDIKPQKHIRIGNLNYYSEEIAKEIIDKLISLTITKVMSKKIEKRLPNFCIEELNKTLKNIIQIIYIDHDSEDVYNASDTYKIVKHSNSDAKRYIYSKHLKGHTKKFEMGEINIKTLLNNSKKLENNNISIDNKISDCLNLSYDKQNNNDIKHPSLNDLKAKLIKQNYWGLIDQPKSSVYHRYASHSNKLYTLYETTNQIKEVEEKHFKKNLKLFTSFNKKKNNNNDEIPIKKKINMVLEMNSLKKLEDKEFIKQIESEEIIQLRKQKIEEIIKQREEAFRKQNSNPLLLSGKDFNEKYNISDIKITNVDIGRNKSIKKPKIRKIYIEEQIKKGNFTLDFNGNIAIINEIDPNKFIEEFPSILSNQKNLGVNTDSNDEENKKINTIHSKEVNRNSINNKNNNTINMHDYKYRNSIIPEFFNDSIEPSGSNYKLINPEIGVTIQEKARRKTGGANFFEKYHKYSINDFNKVLQEIIENEENNSKKKSIDYLNKTGGFKKILPNKEKDNHSLINELSPIKKDLKLLEKTFTNGIGLQKLKNKNNKRILNKSQSEILLKNKYSLIGDLLVKEKKNDNISNIKGKHDALSYRLNQKNLFSKKIKGINNKKKSSFTYEVIDSFNRNLILGGTSNSLFEDLFNKKNKNNLPIIPFKRNKSNFFMENYSNSSMSNFYRTRTKKLYK